MSDKLKKIIDNRVINEGDFYKKEVEVYCIMGSSDLTEGNKYTIVDITEGFMMAPAFIHVINDKGKKEKYVMHRFTPNGKKVFYRHNEDSKQFAIEFNYIKEKYFVYDRNNISIFSGPLNSFDEDVLEDIINKRLYENVVYINEK